jgi:AraC-like DNA-binding protein
METARARLRDTDQPLIELAESLGYQSEAAFGRTFKRVVGVSPGLFRRSSRAGL